MAVNGDSAKEVVSLLERKRYNIAQNAYTMAKLMRDNADICEEFARNFSSMPIDKLAAAGPHVLGGPDWLLSNTLMALASNANSAGAAGLLGPTDGADGKKRKRKRSDKEKKVKDPDAPKRPPSAYLLYQNEVRKAMQEKFKDLPYKEVLGEIAKSWSALSAAEKKMYQDATAVAKESYNEKKSQYDLAHGIPEKAKKGGIPVPAIVATPKALAIATPSDDDDDDDDDEEEEIVKVIPKKESSDEEDEDDESSEEEKPEPPKKKHKEEKVEKKKSKDKKRKD